MMFPNRARSENCAHDADKRDVINPYRRAVLAFPGRVFCFASPGDEQAPRGNETELAARCVADKPRRLLELGSGSGNHLIELARRHPEANCFGFELRYKRSVRTIQKAEQAGVHNLFVFRTDGLFAERYFAPGSVSALYVNFPDPWAKQKQLKHRLLGPELLTTAARLLIPNGTFSVKTDHREYFAGFLAAIHASQFFHVAEQSQDLAQSPYMGENIMTEFEALFRSQGLPIYYLKLRRRALHAPSLTASAVSSATQSMS